MVLCQDLGQIKMSFQISAGQRKILRLRGLKDLLKVIRRHIIAVTVNSFRVVKCFNVFKYQLLCMGVIADSEAIQPCMLYQRMERFNACIIPRISLL